MEILNHAFILFLQIIHTLQPQKDCGINVGRKPGFVMLIKDKNII